MATKIDVIIEDELLDVVDAEAAPSTVAVALPPPPVAQPELPSAVAEPAKPVVIEPQSTKFQKSLCGGRNSDCGSDQVKH